MHSDRDALERILARLGNGDLVHRIGPDRATDSDDATENAYP